MPAQLRALLAGLRRRLLPDGTGRQARYHALRQRWTRWYLGPPEARACPPPSCSFDGADLSVVVIALDAQPELVDAVRSLIGQVPAPEIIVVNSGQPGAADVLAAARLDVAVVVESSCRLFPGAARNVGIAASHGAFVAFLAADCLAHPGWVAARLGRHHAGADLVSSPVVNAHPANPFSIAAHVLLFATRLPGTPAAQRHHYGASYRRTLFSAHGTFCADLLAGEDTEFHQRLPGTVTRSFDARVRTAHRNPRTLRALLEDQYARGRRRALASHALGTPLPPAEIPRMGSARSRRLFRLALEATPGADWPRLLVSTPWIWIAGRAYQRGIRSAAPAPSPESATPRLPLRLVALLQFRNDHDYLAGYLANLAGQVDGLLVLDDGSESPVDARAIQNNGARILEVLRIAPRSPHVWDERRNQRLLLDCARRHRGQWLLALDTDERLEREFRRRADVYMDKGDRDGVTAYSLVLRELWDSPTQYRIDGIWGTKRRPRLFRTRDDHEQSQTPIHAHWAPLNDLRGKRWFAAADLILYHLAMITPAQRQARKMKYQSLDPDKASQAIGYDYLTDETGLSLESISEGREYRPL